MTALVRCLGNGNGHCFSRADWKILYARDTTHMIPPYCLYNDSYIITILDFKRNKRSKRKEIDKVFNLLVILFLSQASQLEDPPPQVTGHLGKSSCHPGFARAVGTAPVHHTHLTHLTHLALGLEKSSLTINTCAASFMAFSICCVRLNDQTGSCIQVIRFLGL